MLKNNKDKIIIEFFGLSGAGKTTLLKWVNSNFNYDDICTLQNLTVKKILFSIIYIILILYFLYFLKIFRRSN